ncbi:hypothetical protein SAMN06265222_101836 [Neorhodopirellula lusitana]|uniref:Zeta toxin n=1 Tax=Neorhodopirellula lusitana TaxID=445327 RepID=A0ABY1PSL3_9BACT|nr:bifunctional aminoglycoside phosphotransferase/ATP-binding protein [Neorhodopirellula lusitana]SMP42762.1 hypothetical protein SAMN06265222_101836 [Neorhodopirellula lusitana]
MIMKADDCVSIKDLIDALQLPNAYPHPVEAPIVVHETHISVVFLAGDFAYKIKKPIQTDFLNYSTLDRRKHFCEEEVRLDGRYADDLYLGVVSVTRDKGLITIQGAGETIEYAVKMRRFPAHALLSERVATGKLTSSEVLLLAKIIADFHHDAVVCKDEIASQWPDFLAKNTEQLLATLRETTEPQTAATLEVLGNWADDFFSQNWQTLTERINSGYIRECHGDLHLANVVYWQGQLVPFDGIEFNDHLRCIDVLSDTAFLAMDLAARGHLDLSRSFLNAYLEQTGDYQSLNLLRLFQCYRSLVRAMAASMRSDAEDAHQHIDLAYRFTLRESPRLWITHGVSGSGKTTLSEAVVQRHDAIRLRSDIERKRLYGLSPTQRPTSELSTSMYGSAANERTYQRLIDLAGGILRAGYSVIVDATFLKKSDRDRFHDLAIQEGVSVAILNCVVDAQTLRQRVTDRAAHGDDASDADLTVLEYQLTHREPLSDAERQHVTEIPNPTQIAEHL